MDADKRGMYRMIPCNLIRVETNTGGLEAGVLIAEGSIGDVSCMIVQYYGRKIYIGMKDVAHLWGCLVSFEG